jgi:hypothetical protein
MRAPESVLNGPYGLWYGEACDACNAEMCGLLLALLCICAALVRTALLGSVQRKSTASDARLIPRLAAAARAATSSVSSDRPMIAASAARVIDGARQMPCYRCGHSSTHDKQHA